MFSLYIFVITWNSAIIVTVSDICINNNNTNFNMAYCSGFIWEKIPRQTKFSAHSSGFILEKIPRQTKFSYEENFSKSWMVF